jgi:hypothetical protein
MAVGDSILDRAAMAEARALLTSRRPPERVWPVLAAATALTLASLVFAAAMVVAPPVATEHVAETAP